MNYSGLSDPNTDLRLHVVLLAVAGANAWFGVPFLSIPLAAWVAARWIVMGVSFLKHRAEVRAVQAWQGRYFAFDGRQVRLHWDEAAVWIEAEDLFHAANRRPDAKTLGRIRRRIGEADFCVPPDLNKPCFSAEGALNYLAGLDDEVAHKLRRWLTREVLPNLDRLRERKADHFERHRLGND